MFMVQVLKIAGKIFIGVTLIAAGGGVLKSL